MKQVVDGKGPPALSQVPGGGPPPDASLTVNICDLYALEAAMAFKEKRADAEITALTIGPEDSDQVVRYALARGADHATRIWHEEISVDDPFTVGMIIAIFARLSGCSLLFCGMMSEDSCSAIVPALVAERLGWNWVNRVIGIEPAKNGSGLRVLQKGERGARLEISCGLPAVLACCPRMQGFNYVSLHRRLLVQQRPVRLHSREDLGFEAPDAVDPPMKILRTRSPKPRTKRTAIASKALTGEDLMWAMISGKGGKKQEDQLIRGDPDELAGKILDFLLEKGMLDPSQLAAKR